MAGHQDRSQRAPPGPRKHVRRSVHARNVFQEHIRQQLLHCGLPHAANVCGPCHTSRQPAEACSGDPCLGTTLCLLWGDVFPAVCSMRPTSKISLTSLSTSGPATRLLCFCMTLAGTTPELPCSRLGSLHVPSASDLARSSNCGDGPRRQFREGTCCAQQCQSVLVQNLRVHPRCRFGMCVQERRLLRVHSEDSIMPQARSRLAK